MEGDDERARLTPYELVFTDGDFESALFPGIRDDLPADTDAERIGRDRFDFVRSAGELVRSMVPPDAPAEALEQYRATLFHAFRFWAEDRRTVVLSKPAARYLVESNPAVDDDRLLIPTSSFYLQLPTNLFWSSISTEAAPEPVDGMFISRTEHEEGADLDVLLVLGIHRGRAGFSVIPIQADLHADASLGGDAAPREGGDFSNALPGGELSGLYSILTISEVFKLIRRVVWYMNAFPNAVRQIEADPPTEEGDIAPTTHLAYSLIALSDGPDGAAG